MRDGVSLILGGAEHRLRLTWGGIDRLRETWGGDDEAFYLRVDGALKARSMADLALLIEVMGGPDAETMSAESPPINPVADAARFAWILAYDGGEMAQEDKEARNPPKSRLIRFWRRWKLRLKRA